MSKNRDSLLIGFPHKRYGEPQRKLKADEAETRVVAAYGYGDYKWGHPQLGEIIAKDLARKDRDTVDSDEPKHVTPNT